MLYCASDQAQFPGARLGNLCRVDVHDAGTGAMRNDGNLGGREDHARRVEHCILSRLELRSSKLRSADLHRTTRRLGEVFRYSGGSVAARSQGPHWRPAFRRGR